MAPLDRVGSIQTKQFAEYTVTTVTNYRTRVLTMNRINDDPSAF
jgi:hypothetical protein